MENRFPHLIAALQAACAALPDNEALRAHLDELTREPSTRPHLQLIAGDAPLFADELPAAHAL